MQKAMVFDLSWISLVKRWQAQTYRPVLCLQLICEVALIVIEMVWLDCSWKRVARAPRRLFSAFLNSSHCQ
jgi:hypothetical protein